jgi:hypothetical protein
VGQVKIEYSIDSGANWQEIVSSTGNDGAYEWTIPGTSSETCLVRVSETDNDPADSSDALFSIVSPSTATITVISPNGGENLNVGSGYNIAWTTTGTIDNVDIEYSLDSGASWNSIVIATANNGIYSWTAADTPSDNCLVRISKADSDGNSSDTSDAVFSIVSSSPSITVTFPNGGEGLIIGSVHRITWTGSAGIAAVDIEYSIDNGHRWSICHRTRYAAALWNFLDNNQ